MKLTVHKHEKQIETEQNELLVFFSLYRSKIYHISISGPFDVVTLNMCRTGIIFTKSTYPLLTYDIYLTCICLRCCFLTV